MVLTIQPKSATTFPMVYRSAPSGIYGHELFAQPPQVFRFPIEGLLPEGITLLGAKNPLHLQSLCLQLASSISAGQPALGLLATSQSTVLYLTTSFASTKYALEQLSSAATQGQCRGFLSEPLSEASRASVGKRVTRHA